MDNSFLNEVKKLFKSKQRIAEEEAQKIKDAVSKEDSVVDTLKELERQFEENNKTKIKDEFTKLPDIIQLERIKYTPKSNEEIKEQVTNELKSEYIKDISEIDSKLFDKASGLKQKADDAEEEKIATKNEIESLYSNLKSKAEKDALKRGIQRSSIISESLKDYDLAKANNINDVEKTYKKAVELIDTELDNLNGERDLALENLDLLQATKMSESIAELTKERDKLSNDVIVRNNKIKQEEANANADLAKEKENLKVLQQNAELKKQADEEEYEKKYGYKPQKQQNYAERYNVALDFYLSLDPDIATGALEASSNMKHYLGNYYDKLYSVLNTRARHTNKYL